MAVKVDTCQYSFYKNMDMVRKYTKNKNACGILFCSTDPNRVCITNVAGEIIEVVITNNTHPPVEKPTNYEKIPTNCVNCGAVLISNQCEYCGTIYR